MSGYNIALIRKRSRYYKRWLKTKNINHKLLNNKTRNLVQRKIKLAKQKYNERFMSKLNVVTTSDLNYWKLLNQKWKPSRKHSYPLNVNGRPIHDRIKCNLFNEYFTSISNSPNNDYQNLPSSDYLTDQRLLSPVIEPFEIFQVLNSLNPNKCKGFDNLLNRILKISSQSLATAFSLLFNFFLLWRISHSLEDCNCNISS